MVSEARYRKLYPRIWRHDGFVALDHVDRLLTLYILTGPQTNRIGCFVFSPGAAAEDLRLSPGTFPKRLANVCGTFGWRFHEPSRVLLITSWWEWNKPENGNVLRGALKDAAELPQTPLYAEFSECSRNVCQTLGVTFPQRLPQTFANSGSVAVTVTGSVAVTEQQQDGSPVVADDDGFAAFWQGYPKKVGKGEALKVWLALEPSLELQATIAAAVAKQRTCRQWLKDGGQYIPNPATWLRQQRWGDDPDPDGPILGGVTAHNLAVGEAWLKGHSS